MFNSIWYQSLTKPKFTPPDWLFSPIWIFLYITIFLSFILYFLKPYKNKKSGYVYFAIEMILNLLWSPIFFGMQNILSAFIVIVLMDIFAVLLIKKFYSVSKISGIILIPYLLWILFATYLNYAYLILN